MATCSTNAGEQRAANLALSVSERELQYVKQFGCGTTQQDRSIMRNPDYRALPYPQLADPLPALEYDTNNKYTAALQSDGFVHPFVDEVTAQSVRPRPTVPGTTMSGVGDLAAITGAYLGDDDDSSRSFYQKIADGIRGGPARVSETPPTRQGFVQDFAAEQRGETSPPNLPIFSEAQVTRQMLYGDGPKKTAAESFLQRGRQHCRATLYDLMHYDAITDDLLRAERCSSKLGYIVSRQGRLPYLLFVLTLVLLLAFFCLVLWRRR